MSGDLVERVARAICTALHGDETHWRIYVLESKAAIRVVVEECALVAQERTPLPAWIDDSANGELTEAAYTFADAIAQNIRALLEDGK